MIPGRRPALHAVILLMVVGALLRFWQLGSASLWLDEAASVKFAGLPWSVLWLSGYDNAPPLYYSVLKLALWFGDSEAMIRVPSVLFGVLTIPVVYWAGRVLAGPRAGLVAALYLTLSVAHVEYSQEARGYSLLVFALCIALVGLLLLFVRSRAAQGAAVDRPGRHVQIAGLALYGLGVLVALYTNNIAVFFVFVAQLVFLYHWITQAHRDRALALRWLLVNALVFLLWLPWLHIVLTQLIGNGSMAWLVQPSVMGAARIWSHVIGFNYVSPSPLGFNLALCLLCLYGALRLRPQPSVAWLLLAVAMLAPLLIWLVGFVHPLYMERTIIWALLGSVLLVAAGVDAMQGWKAPVSVVALIVLSAWSVLGYHATGAAENTDWRTGYAAWERGLDPDMSAQAAIFSSPPPVLPMLYYARHRATLPPLLAWGAGAHGDGTALILDCSAQRAGCGPGHRLSRVPRDLFLWKRGASDGKQKLLPTLPEKGPWRQRAWRRLQVTYAHVPPTIRDDLKAALLLAGWRPGETTQLKRIEIVSYVCIHQGCPLPGRTGPAASAGGGWTTRGH
jgi:hypothetical protein